MHSLISHFILVSFFSFVFIVLAGCGGSGGGGNSTNDNAKPVIPVLSVADASVSEGDSGTRDLVFTISLSEATSNTITLDYATADGSATIGSDYISATNSITIPANTTSATISIQVQSDSLYENDETITLNLSNISNATTTINTATGTIINDDSQPTLLVADVQAVETDDNSGAITFSFSLSSISGLPATFNYATVNDTAVAGADFSYLTGTITIDAGEQTQYITVNLIGNTNHESNRSFTLALSSPGNVQFQNAAPTGLILDDDPPQNMFITPGDQQITFAWDAQQGIQYNLYIASESGVSPDNFNTLQNGMMRSNIINPFTLTGLSNGETYYTVLTADNDAAGESAPTAELFAAPNAVPAQIKRIIASDGNLGDAFGFRVAIDGDYAVVGAYLGSAMDSVPYAGAAYVFHRDPLTYHWDNGVKLIAFDQQSGDGFGVSVDIDGNYIVVGAYNEDGGAGDPLLNAGAAYVFRRLDINTWDSGTKIVAPDAQADDWFGQWVDMDGDYIIVGALHEDGGAGGPAVDAGAGYIFRRTNVNSWDDVVKISATDAAAGDKFGVSVAINGDYAAVGAIYKDNQTGSAYVYRRTALNTWDSGVKIGALDVEQGDWYGSDVDISGDYLVVGARGDNGTTGAAYVHHRTGVNAWDSGSKLTAPDGQSGDRFGFVSIDGDTVIVGADYEDGGPGDPQTDVGAAYLYHRTGTNSWDEGTKLQLMGTEQGDHAGLSVDLSGAYAIVSASGSVTNMGAAHIVKISDIQKHMFAVTFETNTTSKLLTIDTSTGAGTQVGIFSDAIPADLAVYNGDMFIYDMVNNMLYTITPSAVAYSAANLGLNITAEGGLSFRSDGIGFINNDGPQGVSPTLYSFELLPTPSSTPITAAGAFLSGIDGMAFDSDDVLYGMGENLFTINQATGGTNYVGLSGVTRALGLGGLAFTPEGSLYVVIDDNLYSVDKTSGAAILIGSIGFANVTGIAYFIY